MNIQVDPTNSNLASAMLNLKTRPRAVVGYGVKIFHCLIRHVKSKLEKVSSPKFKRALFIKITSLVKVNINSSKIMPPNASLSSVLY